MNVAIIGAGNLGTALAVCIARNGHRVFLWDCDAGVLGDIRKQRANPSRLPGIRIPRGVSVTPDIRAAAENSELIILAVPSFATAEAALSIKDHLRGKVVLAAAKGWDGETPLLPHETLVRIFPPSYHPFISVLGGSAVAAQFVRGVPTTFVAGTRHPLEVGPVVRRALSSKTICVEISDDPLGVALGGALKNIYAIGLGILDGLGSSSNTKAMLTAAAIREISELGVVLGAKHETLTGLAGLGDLVGTGFAVESRNRRYGEAIAKKGLRAAAPLRDHAEGVRAAPIALRISRERRVSLRVLPVVLDIISGQKKPVSLFRKLAGICAR